MLNKTNINIRDINSYDNSKALILLNSRSFRHNRVATLNGQLVKSESIKENIHPGTIASHFPFLSSGISNETIKTAQFIKDRMNENTKAYITNNTIIVKHRITESSFEKIAANYIDMVEYFTLAGLTNAIKSANKITNDIPEKGTEIVIPGIMQLSPDQLKPKKVDKDFAPKGIYLNADLVSNGKLFNYLWKLKDSGCNTVMFDVKDCDGIIRYETGSELAGSIGAVNPTVNLPKLIYRLKKEDIHSVARIALFRDEVLAKKRNDLKLGYTTNCSNSEKDQWVDPTIDEVINYNLSLAVELAKAGVDEINFDYVRFPALGDINMNGLNRVEVITKFLKKAKEALEPYGVRISVDVFAATAWPGNTNTINTIGQDLLEIAKYVDAIYLMAYPSHYIAPEYGNPADHPYEIVNRTYKYAKRLLKDSNVQIVMLYQAFNYKNKDFVYGPEYVFTQFKGGYDAGMKGFLLWNVRGNYDDAFTAINEFREYTDSEIK